MADTALRYAPRHRQRSRRRTSGQSVFRAFRRSRACAWMSKKFTPSVLYSLALTAVRARRADRSEFLPHDLAAFQSSEAGEARIYRAHVVQASIGFLRLRLAKVSEQAPAMPRAQRHAIAAQNLGAQQLVAPHVRPVA